MNGGLNRQLELLWSPWDDLILQQSDGYRDVTGPAILILDDDPLFAELFIERVERHGHFAAYFTGLRHLGSLNKLKHFHAALVDYDLGPGINGIEVAEMFKAYQPNLAIVLTSANQIDVCPTAVEAFVNKEQGFSKILDTVISCVKRSAA